jgi:hypothetical protein
MQEEKQKGQKGAKRTKGPFLPSLLLFALFASSSTSRNRSIGLSRKSRRQRLYKSPAPVSQEYQKERGLVQSFVEIWTQAGVQKIEAEFMPRRIQG